MVSPEILIGRGGSGTRYGHALWTRSGRAPTFLARGVVRERKKQRDCVRGAWLLPRSAHLARTEARGLAGHGTRVGRCGSRSHEASEVSFSGRQKGRSFLEGSILEGRQRESPGTGHVSLLGGTFGTNLTLTISEYKGSFQHKLYYGV